MPERGRTALRLFSPCIWPCRVFVALWLLVVATPARADVRILASPGGEVGSYIKLFSVLRQSGQRVIVDGPCFSACTLVLSSIPRNRICVTPKAVLGFHAPRWVDGQGRPYAATSETRIFVATYPAPVRAWIERHGGLRSKLILLRGAGISVHVSALQLVADCKADDLETNARLAKRARAGPE
jgi:hypothetical protein